MVPYRRLLSATIAALVLGGAAARAQPPDPQPKAVVELFTSQGCSSCPPADALVVELSKSPDVIALTLPVTYWDYLGWRDTLGKDSFAKRQKLYSKARGDGQVYTPQVVLNGASHIVGSDRSEVERVVNQQSAASFAAKITLQEEDGMLRIRLAPANGPVERTAGVWVLPMTRLVSVPITRGENQGKTLSYANVVRGFVRVGDWNGAETVLTTPLGSTQAPEADGYVVIVQSDQPSRYGMMPGMILGAARGTR
jgi:hypothetical protein